VEERIEHSKGGFGDPHNPSESGHGEIEPEVTPPRVKKNSILLIVAVAFLSAILGGIIAVLAVPYLYGSTPAEVFGSRGLAINPKEIIRVDKGKVSPVTAVAKKLMPSIVNINIKQSISGLTHPDVVSGAGSGIIYSSDGYIVTNEHVISDAKEIFVTIGSQEVKGKLVASDKDTDVAVIKVDKTGLPVAEFGSTKNLQVGDLAVAIGSPFGFEHTVTSGIISALNRTVSMPTEDVQDTQTYTNLIQTDAPINPGNSGGALSDAQGRVIGMNSLIYSKSGVTEGVGFAIPIETVISVTRQLIEKGSASHPFAGIMGQNLDIGSASNSNLGADKGAIIVGVVKGGPADKAGLKKQDVVVAVDGKQIESMDELIAEVRQRKVGETLEIDYLRAGKPGSTQLTLVEKPNS
jgi:S1-C subfamily serine protease